MDFGVGAYATGLVAGSLSILSPCVLPVVPILLGTAVGVDRRGPLVLAGGLALSFALIGTLLASVGASIGLDGERFRTVGAVLLVLFGLTLLVSRMQAGFASATARVGDVGHGLLRGMRLDGLAGQFAIGLLLGVVWSPCVGPTLGAAIMLASQGSQLPQVALLMSLFGIGAALPVVLLGLASRSVVSRARSPLLRAGRIGKVVMGSAMLLLAALILSGADKGIESWLVDRSPDWLTTLTTRF